MSSTLTAGAGVGSRRRGGLAGEHLAALCIRYLRRFGPAFATHQEAFQVFGIVRARRTPAASTWDVVRGLLCEPDGFLVFIDRTLYQLDRARAERICELVRDPRPTQLYRHYDKRGVLLYVGISLNAIGRLTQHRRDAAWFHKIARVEIATLPNLGAALHAERKAIKKEAPIYNRSRIEPDAGDPLRKIAKICRDHAQRIDGRGRHAIDRR